MPINNREIIEAVSIIADNHNIKVTVKHSLKASFIVGGTTFLGSIMMGPLGILAGATAGSIYAYNQSKDKFKSAAVIIRDELTEDEKNRLVMHITEAFKDFRPEDAAIFVGLLMSNQALVVNRVIQFLVSEMRMQIID